MKYSKRTIFSARWTQWCTGAVFVLLVGVSAQAQRELKIKIRLFRPCSAGDRIVVVFDGDESNPSFIPCKEDSSGVFWIPQWFDERPKKFPEEPLSASLRLNDWRSDCRMAKEEKAAGVPVASFKFFDDSQAVKTVKIQTEMEDDSRLPVSYVRRIEKSPIDHGDDLDCECVERDAREGSAEIRRTRFPAERVLLQLGLRKANPDGPGLLVFSNSAVRGLLTQDLKIGSAVDRRFKKDVTEIKGGLRLSRRGVERALLVKRSRVNGDFSSDGATVDAKLLTKLKTVEVTVEK